MDKTDKTSLRRTAATARHPTPRHLLALGMLAAAASTGTPARAAGGHHAVDDAALLDR